MSKQRQLALTAIMWSNEHDGKLPDAKEWASTIKVEDKLLTCPTQGHKNNGGNSYGYNFAVGGKKIKEIKEFATTVLTADCMNTVKDRILRTPADFDPRHKGKVICSYVDGHVELTTAPATLSLPPAEKKKVGK